MAQLPGSAQESTATLLAGYVHAAGVRHVFGYPGESVIDFMEAARHRGIQVVSAVREGTAAFMAEAAATAGGRLGVCLSTLGPGSTAVLNGVASATLDRVPVLAVSGQIESSREQYFTHQVVDHDRMFAPVSKLALRLDPASADTVIRKALRTAVAERPGAVHLTVTADAWSVPASGPVRLPPLAPAAASVDVHCAGHGHGDPVRTLTAARRPVILAGIAALRCGAGPELVRLAELAGIPVVVSPMAKGVFPEDHPYFAGVLDMAGYRVVWDLLAGAGLILAAGFDPVELISPWSVATPVLHLDTTPNTDQVYPSAHELTGHVGAILSPRRPHPVRGPVLTSPPPPCPRPCPCPPRPPRPAPPRPRPARPAPALAPAPAPPRLASPQPPWGEGPLPPSIGCRGPLPPNALAHPSPSNPGLRDRHNCTTALGARTFPAHSYD